MRGIVPASYGWCTGGCPQSKEQKYFPFTSALQLLKCLNIYFFFIIVVGAGGKCCKGSPQKIYSPGGRIVTHNYTIRLTVLSPTGHTKKCHGSPVDGS